MTNAMKKTKYTTCGANKDSQCNLQPATENMLAKEKTDGSCYLLLSPDIVAKRVLYEQYRLMRVY